MKKVKITLFTFIFILLMLSTFMSTVLAVEVKEDEEPKLYRMKAEFSYKQDLEKHTRFPMIRIKSVNWETGRLYNKEYSFPEYSTHMPEGFNVVKNNDINEIWENDGEFFHMDSQLGQYQYVHIIEKMVE